MLSQPFDAFSRLSFPSSNDAVNCREVRGELKEFREATKRDIEPLRSSLRRTADDEEYFVLVLD
jgi:hypothetical protein